MYYLYDIEQSIKSMDLCVRHTYAKVKKNKQKHCTLMLKLHTRYCSCIHYCGTHTATQTVL